MAIQQGTPNTGYRDPMKAMSVKALQERQKAAALATATAMKAPEQMPSPMQGLAHLTGVLGAQYTQNRADSAEAAGRQKLAQLKAQIDPNTGATQQQLAEIGVLDQEFADKEQERVMTELAAVRNREDMQQAATDLQAGQQAFQGDQNDLNRQADIARQKLSDANAAGRQDDAQAATVELANINAEIDKRKAADAETAKVAAIGTQTDAKVAEAKKLGLVEGTPEYQKFVYDMTKPGNTYIGGEAPAFAKKSDELAATRFDDIVKEGAAAKPFIAQLRIVADLGKQIGTGKGAQVVQALGPYARMVGLDLDVFKGLDEGQAFQAIVDKMAPNMRVQGAGASSDFDARQFLSSLPSLGRTPEGNKLINDTFEALMQNKMQAADLAAQAQGGQITWQDAEAKIRALPNPYDTFKQLQGGGSEAPADAGGGAPADAGGAYQPPVFDPARDHEGDTGKDEKGTWTVQGNKWVLTAPAGQ